MPYQPHGQEYTEARRKPNKDLATNAAHRGCR